MIWLLLLMASVGVIWIGQGLYMILWSLWEIFRQTVWPD